jgi:SynChlorMet cassette protein ScmD
MKNDEKPIANPVVVLREEFDDWAVLFDPDSGNAFGLSPTGVYVWKFLDGEHTLDALLLNIRAHADNVPEDASDHIKAFVDALVAEGLAGFDIAGPDLRNDADRAELHPEQCSCSPLQASWAKVLGYKPPELVDLRTVETGYGACSDGSSNAGQCYWGAAAGTLCQRGSANTTDCQAGNSAMVWCFGGGVT